MTVAPEALARLRRRGWLWLATTLAVLCVLGGLGAAALHASNRYPRHFAVAETSRAHGEHYWLNLCDSGRRTHPPEFVDCTEARVRAGIDAHRVALELCVIETLHDAQVWLGQLLGAFNPLAWLGCSAGSQCQFVVLSCVHALFSSVLLMGTVVSVLVAGLAYAFWQGPLRALAEYRLQRMLLGSAEARHKKTDEVELTCFDNPAFFVHSARPRTATLPPPPQREGERE
jgi:hypothetical protein